MESMTVFLRFQLLSLFVSYQNNDLIKNVVGPANPPGNDKFMEIWYFVWSWKEYKFLKNIQDFRMVEVRDAFGPPMDNVQKLLTQTLLWG